MRSEEQGVHRTHTSGAHAVKQWTDSLVLSAGVGWLAGCSQSGTARSGTIKPLEACHAMAGGVPYISSQSSSRRALLHLPASSSTASSRAASLALTATFCVSLRASLLSAASTAAAGSV